MAVYDITFFELLNKWKFLSFMDKDSVVKRNKKTSSEYLYNLL